MKKIIKVIKFIKEDLSLKELYDLHKSKCKKEWKETDWKKFQLY